MWGHRRSYWRKTARQQKNINVSPRMVYCDESKPELMDGFVKKTIIPMVEGVEKQALKLKYIDKDSWYKGIRDLHKTGTPPEGTFCYTFFKGIGIKIAVNKEVLSMNILVILGHQEKGSFNHAIAGNAVKTLKRNGHNVIGPGWPMNSLQATAGKGYLSAC